MLTPEESEKIEYLYRRYNAKLFCVAAAAFYNNRSLAEDAVSQAFLVACQNPQKLIGHPNPEAWLVTVLHKVISHEKRQRAKYQAVLLGVMPLLKNDTPENRLQLETMYPGLRDMPEFMLIKRYAVEQCSIAEIARRLDISVSACKKRMERARKTLAVLLKER